MSERVKREFPHVVIDDRTGKETVLPGYYPELSNEDYHEGPGLSSSSAKTLIMKSGLHYWDSKLNPDQPEREPRKQGDKLDVLDFGSAYHTITLEPDKFEQEYIKAAKLPKGMTLRHKKGREYMEEFAKDNADKIIINEEDMHNLTNMADRVRKHPKASRILELGKGVIESSFFGIDDETGALVKIRPDYLRKDMYIADLKSTACASNEEFARSVYKYGYHISAAMYLDVFKSITGCDFEGKFIFVAQEKVRPYAIANFVISDEAIDLGREQYRKAVNLFAKYTEQYGTDPWPGYPDDIQAVDLPAYAYRK